MVLVEMRDESVPECAWIRSDIDAMWTHKWEGLWVR